MGNMARFAEPTGTVNRWRVVSEEPLDQGKAWVSFWHAPTPPFRYFKASPEMIRLAVMLCICFPLSRPSIKNLPHERGIEISYETVGLQC